MENTNQIENYILGKMPAKEESEFKKRLDNEPELRVKKEEMEKLIIGVESFQLKNKIANRKIGAQDKSRILDIHQKKQSKIFTLRKLSIAAGFIGILFIATFIINNSRGTKASSFASIFEEDPGLPTPMSETKNYNFYDAMVDYKMKKYGTAINKWKLEVGNTGTDTLNYYLGMAYLNSGNLEEASNALQSVPKSSTFSDLAHWYQVKILIDAGEFEQAKLLLNSLPANVNPNYAKLLQILKDQK